MSKHIERELVADKAIVHEAMPAKARHEVNRTFEIPPIVYGLTVGCYLGFLGIMTLAVGNPELIIPMVIFAFFIVAGFGLPTIWTRMQPENRSRELTWARFMSEGVQTHTGRLRGSEAMAQVLVLPVLVVCWGLAIALMIALV